MKVQGFEIKNDYSDKVIAEMKERLVVALEAVGEECEGYAKADCPVDTGRLRDSIAHKVKKDEYSVYIGTNVEYATVQEFGDFNHKVGKKHYLKDAAANHADHYKAVLKAALG